MLERIVSYRGAMDIALPIHAKGLGLDSRRRTLFIFSSSFCFVLFRFFKNIFSFFGRHKLQVNYQFSFLK